MISKGALNIARRPALLAYPSSLRNALRIVARRPYSRAAPSRPPGVDGTNSRYFTVTAVKPSPAQETGQSEALATSTTLNGPKPRRSLRPLIYATVFLLIGLTAGNFFRAMILPPPLPIPGTPEDEHLGSVLCKYVDDLPIVKELRNHRGEWVEYDAYMAQPAEESASSLTAGAMRGSRGLGVHRVFWNEKERRSIAIVFLGGALAGWPGVTHGGAIATILFENLERVANGPGFGEETQGSLRLGELTVRYRKPTPANSLFVVRAEVDDSGVLEEVTTNKTWAKATVENALSGVVCVEARASCSASTGAIILDWTKDGTASSSSSSSSSSRWQSVRSSIFG